MRILGHIHTLNDEDVVPLSLAALRAQTRPLDDLVVVDNGSTDGTLDFLAKQAIKLVVHTENLGTSGSVRSGMQVALDEGYDWIWLFDADTAAYPDALERLLAAYAALPEQERERTWLLSSYHIEWPTKSRWPLTGASPEAGEGRQRSAAVHPAYQAIYGPRGLQPLIPEPEPRVCPFDSTIWSGALYRMDAVERVGLPRADYVLDWAEHEYGYQGRQRGYRALLVQDSLVEHNIGDEGPAIAYTRYRLGPLTLTFRELPAIRCYYIIRNAVDFWFFEYRGGPGTAVLIPMLRMLKLTANFVIRAPVRPRQAAACLRGWWDGFLRRLGKRY